jgi:hypothetical protein
MKCAAALRPMSNVRDQDCEAAVSQSTLHHREVAADERRNRLLSVDSDTWVGVFRYCLAFADRPACDALPKHTCAGPDLDSRKWRVSDRLRGFIQV